MAAIAALPWARRVDTQLCAMVEDPAIGVSNTRQVPASAA
ncbi:hypothetical protein Z949_2787 [Sulfitobacter guttiformis KCTC 32187]|nr:hypothetical protein Z949_2787 [Sulfitobacter guttiformis KCTC 32187]